MTKTVFITGCSSGIGYEAAHALVKQGFHVIASCRKQADVERLQLDGLTCIQLDLADNDSILNAVKKIKKITNGELFALFNNGAYGQPGALEDLPTDALRQQFEINVFGWHTLTQALLPLMFKRGEGRIVQNSSVLGFVALKYRGAYNASKFAIEGWTDTLRLELENTPIQVSLIEPGPIETKFRINALQAFHQHIKVKGSRHEQAYLGQEKRLEAKESESQYTLPASAIMPSLIHALTAKRAKIRYRVTKPTTYMWLFKRLLPSRWLDFILLKGV